MQRAGGIAFEAYSFTIDDPAQLAELAALLPAELPQIGEPQGACADCWSYRFVFDYVDANEAILREYDDVSVPDSLQAFTAAINDYIGSGAVQPQRARRQLTPGRLAARRSVQRRGMARARLPLPLE